jgi:Concanavalin A-like lectin/glucanases superfamily
MSFLLLGQDLYRQPQDYTEVNWENPVTAGLLLLTNGEHRSNLAGAPEITTAGSLPRGVGQSGVGLSFNNNTNNYLTAPYSASAPSGTGLAWFHLPTAASGSNRGIVGIYRTSGGSPGGDASYLTLDAAGTFSAFSTDNNNFIAASTAVPAFNRDYVLAGTFLSGGGRSLWLDGEKVATEGTARTPAGITTALVGVYSDGAGARSSPFTGTIYMSAWWTRVLTDEEVRSVSKNPQQLLRSPARSFLQPSAPASSLFRSYFTTG